MAISLFTYLIFYQIEVFYDFIVEAVKNNKKKQNHISIALYNLRTSILLI